MADSIQGAAMEHFKRVRGELQFIEVPEWEVNGKPAKIYYFARPNVDEFLKIAEHVKSDASGIKFDAYIEAFMLFARDENGKRLFGQHQKTSIHEQFDPAIVMYVVNQMGVFSNMLSNGGVENAKND